MAKRPRNSITATRAPSASNESTRRWLPLLIAVITFLTFARVVTYEFLDWDDFDNIVRNPDLNPPTPRSVAAYWAKPHMSLYIPVTYTVWGAVAAVSGLGEPDALGVRLNPMQFHAVNVLIHVVAAVLAFDVLRLLVSHDLPALLGALLFALHPVQVEPVAWVSGTKDVLSGALALAAIGQYVRYARLSNGAGSVRHGSVDDATPSRRPVVHLAAATVFFV